MVFTACAARKVEIKPIPAENRVKPDMEVTIVIIYDTYIDVLGVSVNKLKIAHPNQDALSVLEQMEESNINQMLVASEGRVIGLITRDTLISFLRIRSELGM